MTTVRLKTGAWYQDRDIDLSFPEDWEVVAHWPTTPPALDDAAIAARLDAPQGGLPLAEHVAGASKVAIVVDDLTRPTPAHRVLPMLIDRIRAAGKDIDISVIVATGTHGHQDTDALRHKLGARAFDECTVEVHDDLRNTRRIGTTSYKTPVFVNRTVLAADRLIGVGGVYPQYTTGFGGGAKLALGICGRPTIMGLHFKHKSMEGRYNTDNDFRKDVAEIANMIGLNLTFTLHINAYSEVVNAVFGDHNHFYDEAARFSKERYLAPRAEQADIVVANAYPLDTSFTFMRKGYKPLYTAPRSMVKVMIAAAHEGIGVHGLFQYINPSRLSRIRNLMLRAWSMDKKELLQKVLKRLAGLVNRSDAGGNDDEEEETTVLPPNTDHLYVWRTDAQGVEIPDMDGVTVRADWDELLGIIRRDHFAGRDSVRAIVYPSAPIQCIEDPPADSA